MFSLTGILITTAIFVAVLTGIALLDRIGDRLDRFRSIPRAGRTGRHSDRTPVKCKECGGLFAAGTLVDGTCIFCAEHSGFSSIGGEERQAKPETDSGLTEYYRVLGCKESDSDQEIKRKYYKRAKVIHPDMLSQEDLPESELQHRTLEFQMLQDAYSRIMEHRRAKS